MANDIINSTSPASLQKVRQLIAYLRDFVSLRSKATKKVESYQRQGAVVWFHEMPHEKDCQSLIWNEKQEDDDDVWLRVRQQKMPRRPPVPDDLIPWVDEQNLQRTEEDFEPALEPVALIPRRLDSGQFAEPEEQRLEEHPEIQRAWNNYLPSWMAWAKDYRRKQRVQRVYRELYAIHQQLEQNGEMVELSLGLGLLQWKRPSGEIRRHVLTYRTELKFDLDQGEISLLYPESGARPIVEDDMLEPDDRPVPSLSQEALKHRHALVEDPWNQSKLENFFGAWAKALHNAGHASMSLSPADSSTEDPIIDFAPALLLRPRGTAPILQVYNALHEQLSAENPVIPFGLLRLVEDLHDEDQVHRNGTNGNGIKISES